LRGSTSSARAAADRAWLEEHFDFHRSTTRRLQPQPAPKVDEYDDYLFVAALPALRQEIGA
jgi:Mg2+ and Co2+ transporter CorA